MVGIVPAGGYWTGNGPLAFFAGTATVTTTGTQAVTAVISAYGQTSASPLVASCNFSMCSRPAGTTGAPTRFNLMATLFVRVADTVSTFTASESASLGAGTFEVGLCGQVVGGNNVSGAASGWVMVTN